jgi:hypothetical protein
MKEISKIESQVKALEYILNNGIVKNPYAIKGKINNLKKQLESMQKEVAWKKFLSQ